MSGSINWKRGDVLETRKGLQYMFGHHDKKGGFWVHRITKSGKMDQGSLGLWIEKEGVVPATLDVGKRGGWPVQKHKSPPKKPRLEHQWSGAGYVCSVCGGIKDTSTIPTECPGKGKSGFDVWLYHAGAGWWLDEFELDSHTEAVAVLKRKIGTGNVVAGSILPAGQPLGLFYKQWSFSDEKKARKRK